MMSTEPVWRGHSQFTAQRPEAQQADTVFSVDTLSLAFAQVSLHRIADVRGDVAKIGKSVGVQYDSATIVSDLHPDFAEIYTHAKRRGMIITVFTNATMVSDDILQLFRDRKISPAHRTNRPRAVSLEAPIFSKFPDPGDAI